MTEFLLEYGLLIVTLLFSAGFIISIIPRNDTTAEGQEIKTTLWSHLSVRPLLLGSKEGERDIPRGLTEREWIGWLIYALMALVTILFTTIRK